MVIPTTIYLSKYRFNLADAWELAVYYAQKLNLAFTVDDVGWAYKVYQFQNRR